MQTSTIKSFFSTQPEGVLQIMRWLLIRPLRTYFRYVPFLPGKRRLWRSLTAHLWWLESRVKATTVFGSTLYVDAKCIVGKHLYYFGVWEPNLTDWIRRRLGPGDVFVDVGANIGYFSALASKLVGDSGKVVAIEALPRIFRRLKQNMETNRAGNVRLENMAAWHREERLSVFTQPDHPAGTTTVMDSWADLMQLKADGQVAAKPLPAILRPDEIRAVRLIKIDVEGAEWNVISGLLPMLAACRQDVEIIVEISRSMLEAQGKTLRDFFNALHDFGFHPYRIVNDYSASAYINPPAVTRPERIKQMPEGPEDQLDVIFSRIDAAWL